MRYSHQPLTVLCKLTLLIALAGSLTGCLSVRIVESNKIREQIEPRSIVLGDDGTVAIKANCSYYREGLFDEDKKIPVTGSPPQECYLMLSSKYLRDQVKGHKPSSEGVYSVQYIRLPAQGSANDAPQVVGLTNDLIAPGVQAGPLPASFELTEAMQRRIYESVAVKDGNGTLYVNFSKLKVESDRTSSAPWWAYSMAVPVGVVEGGGMVVLGAAEAVVGVPLTIGAFGALIIWFAVEAAT